MNNISRPSLLALLFFGALSLNAQDNPSVHQKEGRTYVNKALPIYLQFKTEPNGKTYDLNSAKNPQDANPMYLDTEGVNYIRSKWAVDSATGKKIYPEREVLMEIFCDGEAPSTSISLKKCTTLCFGRSGLLWRRPYDGA